MTKKTPIAIYIHGYASKPDPKNLKVQMLTELGFKVLLFDAEGNKPSDYFSGISKLLQSHNIDMVFDDVLFCGTSLGGFWARRFAYFCSKKPFIIFNPVVDPLVDIQTIDPALSEFYRDIHPIETQDTPGLVVIAKNDPIIPANPSIGFFSSRNQVLVLNSDDHRLADTTMYFDAVKDFVDQMHFNFE